MPSVRTDDGLLLHYGDDGKGDPLVFIHGWMMAGTVWLPQIDHFSRTHRVITPDLRGCGRSESRGGTYTMARYAADLDQLLSSLAVRGATLVGWSMGGGITMEYLERYGDARVARIGLVDFPPRLEEDASVAEKVCHSLNTRREGFLDGFLKRMLLDPGQGSNLALLRAQAELCRSETACEMYRAMRPTGPSRAGSLHTPAFLAFPTHGWFPQALPAWKQRLPRHSAPTFEASKHCPFLEQAELFNQELERFLQG